MSTRGDAPTNLRGVTVVLGVSGGIAAYKAVEVCRRLVDAGAEVHPILTRAALRFVGEATFAALASARPRTSLFDDDDPIPHTSLGQSADVVVVCPATARVIGSYASGISSDLLTATLLATRAPVVVAPAMHTEMWEHPAVQENVDTLRRRGVTVVPPGEGRLAGGDVGAGRLAEPAEIVQAVAATLDAGPLAGVSVLVTAGGTREPIDPVRFIGNRSSGKQGYAIAAEAAAMGATVTLVTTVDRATPFMAEVVSVETAAELRDAVMARADSDVVVMAAAVADFRPAEPADAKLKKRDGVPSLELAPTSDILAELGKAKPPGQLLVGFAAETGEVESNAAAKLQEKGVDLIVANDVSAPGAGFGHDTNEVVIFGADGVVAKVSLAAKSEVARIVLGAVREVRASGA